MMRSPTLLASLSAARADVQSNGVNMNGVTLGEVSVNITLDGNLLISVTWPGSYTGIIGDRSSLAQP